MMFGLMFILDPCTFLNSCLPDSFSSTSTPRNVPHCRLPLWYVSETAPCRIFHDKRLMLSGCGVRVVHVFCETKPGTASDFLKASLINAGESSKEPGIARFDVLQDKDDENKFCLVEVYKNTEAPAQHKETAHYLAWRETVADMMTKPREARKFHNRYPTTSVGWDYPEDISQLKSS